MEEFFGFGGYTRPAEGFLSWQHLTFVTALVIVMTVAAVVLGIRNKNRTAKEQNRVLIVAALAIDLFELAKIVLFCFRSGNPWDWIYSLPLFLCSIQLITLPLAAFSKGRLKEAALDFVAIFGLLGALLGTYGAGNNYGTYPVLAFDNVVSGITHTLSGFAALYILITGMAGMRKKNMVLTFGILLGFCVAAYTADMTIEGANYMFLMCGDGTPYDILYQLVGGHPVWYPLGVVALFLLYIGAFYAAFFLFRRRSSRLETVCVEEIADREAVTTAER